MPKPRKSVTPSVKDVMEKKKQQQPPAAPSEAEGLDELIDVSFIADALEESAPSVPAPDPAAPPAKPAAKKLPPSRAAAPTSARVKEIQSDVAAPRPAAATTVQPRAYRDMDAAARTLTKKQRSQLEVWTGNNRGRALDAFFRAQLTQNRTASGHESVIAANEADKLLIGIPTPAFIWEYLTGHDAFLLSLLYHINGPKHTGKSALLYEIFRWFRLAGGGSFLNEAESKLSAELLQSIVGFERDEVNVLIKICNSVEDWQTGLVHGIPEQQKRLVGTKEAPGPGKTIPMCFGVDSVAGKLSAETQERVAESGHGNRSYPVEALQITQAIKTVPSLISDWPFAIVLLNHLKLSKDNDGREERRTSGGSGIGFQESFEIETSVARQKLECASYKGVQYRFRVIKNSFGDNLRKAESRLIWWDEVDPETGYRVQRTQWDWDWAMINLLHRLEGREKANFADSGIHLHCPQTGDFTATAWSKNLGMKADHAVPWSELGRRFRETPEILDRIRQALSIRRRTLLTGDYSQQLDAIRQTL